MKKKERKNIGEIEVFRADTENHMKLPFADGGIYAGFPSPAQDYMDIALDLNEVLIKHPSATFFGRVKGNSLQDAGVDEGDILIIDKSIAASDGDMAVCFVDGDFTLKFIQHDGNGILLIPANRAYEPIRITEENDFQIWGIVTYTIKRRKLI